MHTLLLRQLMHTYTQPYLRAFVINVFHLHHFLMLIIFINSPKLTIFIAHLIIFI